MLFQYSKGFLGKSYSLQRCKNYKFIPTIKHLALKRILSVALNASLKKCPLLVHCEARFTNWSSAENVGLNYKTASRILTEERHDHSVVL